MSAATASASVSGLDEDAQRQIAAGTHHEKPLPVSQAAAASAKRARASRPSRASASLPSPSPARRTTWADEPATSTLAAATAGEAGRQPTSPPARRRTCPTTAAARGRAGVLGPRRPWRRAFQCCTSPGNSGASAIPRRPGRRQPPAPWRSPDHPHSRCEQRHEPSAASTRCTCRCCRSGAASRAAPRATTTRSGRRPLLDQVRHVAAIGDLLDDARLAAHGDPRCGRRTASSTSRSGFVKPRSSSREPAPRAGRRPRRGQAPRAGLAKEREGGGQGHERQRDRGGGERAGRGQVEADLCRYRARLRGDAHERAEEQPRREPEQDTRACEREERCPQRERAFPPRRQRREPAAGRAERVRRLDEQKTASATSRRAPRARSAPDPVGDAALHGNVQQRLEVEPPDANPFSGGRPAIAMAPTRSCCPTTAFAAAARRAGRSRASRRRARTRRRRGRGAP